LAFVVDEEIIVVVYLDDGYDFPCAALFSNHGWIELELQITWTYYIHLLK